MSGLWLLIAALAVTPAEEEQAELNKKIDSERALLLYLRARRTE